MAKKVASVFCFFFKTRYNIRKKNTSYFDKNHKPILFKINLLYTIKNVLKNRHVTQQCLRFLSIICLFLYTDFLVNYNQKDTNYLKQNLSEEKYLVQPKLIDFIT